MIFKCEFLINKGEYNIAWQKRGDLATMCDDQHSFSFASYHLHMITMISSRTISLFFRKIPFCCFHVCLQAIYYALSDLEIHSDEVVLIFTTLNTISKIEKYHSLNNALT